MSDNSDHSDCDSRQLRRLLRQRAVIKGCITKITNFFAEADAGLSTHIVSTKEERLRESFQKFEALNLEVCALDPEADDMGVVESKFLQTLALIKELQSQSQLTSLAENPRKHTLVPSAKLPQIDLPTFTGKYSDYKPFIGMFNALIDSNDSLADIQKLFYLRNNLKNEPFELIKNLPIISESYLEAKNILRDRYDNKFKITSEHISALLDLQPMLKSTAYNIRQFVSVVKQQLAALKNLNYEVHQWDPIMLCILSRKLDLICSREFQLHCSSEPSVNNLLTFLESRALALENSERVQVQPPKAAHMVTVKSVAGSDPAPPTPVCIACKLPHKLFACNKFKLMSATARLKFIKDNGLCNICLNEHKQKCRYRFKCSLCQQNHNTLLHQDDKVESPVTLFSEAAGHQIILPTARVKLIASNGTELHVKALLDSGSQASFITTELVSLMSLKPIQVNTPVVGIGNKKNEIRDCVNIQLHSLINNFSINVTCHVLDNITSKLPQSRISMRDIVLPCNITLADNKFNEPSVIHILLGADIFFQVLLPNVVDPDSTSCHGVPVFNTQFGHIVAGSVPVVHHQKQVTSLHCNLCDNALDNTLQQFWKLENVPEVFHEKLPEHETCERLFCKTVTLDTQNNKFQVALPLKLPIELVNEVLGDSFSLALKRFRNLEIRFQKDDFLFQLYKDFIHNYLKEGYGTVIDISQYDLSTDPVYFLPHHPVLRLDKKSTKCRVVFDGSMKTSKKVSLNDMLLNGPVVQKELIDILFLFRVDKYIFVTDIKSMFLRISLDPMYRTLQNILWRDSPNEDIQCIQLNTVTFGLKCSSYLATRCLKELADRYRGDYPLAASIIENSTYVDDAIVSQKSPELLIEAKSQLCDLLNKGGFHLHKWFSNCPQLLDEIPKSQQYFDDVDLEKGNISLKTLGVKYNVNTDSLMLHPKPNASMPATKREILSFVGQFFDPLGLAGPVVLKAKVIMQRLWQAHIHWDAQLPHYILNEWREFYNSFCLMLPIAIPRYINLCESVSVEIIGFADAASSTAYGCCVYLRIVDSTGNIKVSLLCSKSRVNPLKQSLTVPRLELNAMVLLAKCAARLHSTLQLKLNIDNVVLYSDSQIALAWVKSNITTLKTYVANRVKVITELTCKFCWSYISSEENPADCLSRGVLPHELQDHPLWWQGPGFLHTSEYQSQYLPRLPVIESCDLPEVKVDPVCPTTLVCRVLYDQELCLNFLEKYSDISKMQRILAYVFRFLRNTRDKGNKNKFNYLTSKELNESLLVIVNYEQQKYFKDEFLQLKCKNEITKGNLKPLYPFVDNLGLLRVGGRLENASIPYKQKHPLILPKDSRITHLIIKREHIRNLHAGPRLVMSTINQTFWIVHGIREVKKVIYKCITCFKLKAETAKQLMGSLPHDRINVCRPFQKVGIDFAGPIMIKQSRIRKALETKAYVCVFVCFATKAIHFELASDLKTVTFLACLKRFIARRGLPTDVYSDNASTFKSASSQLTELYKLHNSKEHQKEIHDFSSQNGINFHFVPCYSPIFAGLAEAGVKSMKFHLKRVVQKTLLTYEEMNTILCQIESILNSRPLMPLSNDVNDFSCITPGHFLIGSALNAFPEQDVTLTDNLKFWKICTSIKNSFWKVWSRQYLNILQSRPKWKESHPNIKVGSLVLLKENDVAPLFWPMARVVNVFPGSDNRVRVVEVKTPNGKTHRRSIVKVCLLPIEL